LTRSSENPEQAASRTVERVVALIGVLAEEARPLAIADITEATGWPQATVHRLLASLVAMDWVEKEPATAHYRLGHGLLGPSAVVLTSSPLVERAQPLINRIAELSQANCLLAVLVGRNVVFLSRAAPGQEASTTLQAGLTRPAHASAAGKVMLAFLTPEQRGRLYRGRAQLRQFTPNTITSLDRLERELGAARANGYAIEDGEYREYMRSVAVPVHGTDGRVIAAITCSGRPERMTDEHIDWIKEEMAHMAEELSRQTGLVS
jgi:DNA-binding IclR family transcriptional regulator